MGANAAIPKSTLEEPPAVVLALRWGAKNMARGAVFGFVGVILASAFGCGGLVDGDSSSKSGTTSQPAVDAGGSETSGTFTSDAGASTEPQNESWSTSFSANSPLVMCTATSPKGAVGVAIETESNDGLSDPFQLEVRLFENDGSLRWTQTIADRPEPFAVIGACSLTFDGEDLVVGDSREHDATQNAPILGFLARLGASDGRTLWSSMFGSAEYLALTSIVVGATEVFVAGTTYNGSTGLTGDVAPSDSVGFVAAFDAATGAVRRATEWPIQTTSDLGLALRPDGDISLVGAFGGSVDIIGADGVGLSLTTTDANGAGFIARFGPDLVLKNFAALDLGGAPPPSRVAFDTAGGFVAATSLAAMAVDRFDADGNLLSTTTANDPTSFYRSIPALAVASSGEAVIPLEGGLAAFASGGGVMTAHVSYAGVFFQSLSPSGAGVVAAGTFDAPVDFGTGLISATPAPGLTAVFVARGKLW